MDYICTYRCVIYRLSPILNTLNSKILQLFRFMKYILPWPALILLLFGCEQLTLSSVDEPTFVIESVNTGYAYEMTVLLPPDYDEGQLYPTVYLVDGHWHYSNVAADALRMMRRDQIRDVILVGVAYADIPPNTLGGFGEISQIRIDDFTFPKNVETDTLGGLSFEFREFFKEELIPEVERRYSTSADERTLMGHSLGGYFGYWEMFTFSDSSLFQYVEAGSPALWWADGYLLGVADSLAAQNQALPFRLHTTMGKLESVVWNTFFDELEERFTESEPEGLIYSFERYPYGHSAMAEVGFREGLLYFFGQ